MPFGVRTWESVIAVFQPPPTWADPVLTDEATGKSTFNPIWLKWFIDLVQIIDDSGGTSINHNDTANLQGGQANQFYHLNAAQQALAVLIFVTGLRPPTPAGVAQTTLKLTGNTGAPNNAEGADGDFYFRSDGTVAGNTVIYHKQAGAWVALVTA